MRNDVSGPDQLVGQINQVNSNSHRTALDQLRRDNPSLARAADDGFIAGDDYNLLVF
jgi:hypothetical protein